MHCPNCRYTGTHHPCCPQRHVVSGGGGHPHHGHGHGGGFWGGPGYDYPYPVYVTCPVGWTTDQYGNCQPPGHKVGQDMAPNQPVGFNPFNPFGMGFQVQQSREATDLNNEILTADSRVAQGTPKIPPALLQQYMTFRASWTSMYNAGNLSVAQTNGARSNFQALLAQLQPYIDTAGIMPQSGGLLGGLGTAGAGLGKGISDAALYIGLAGLAIVGVVAYTAYKTDAPRHAADVARSGISRADESSRMAAKLLV